MKIITISDTHNKHFEISNRFLENKDNSIEMIIHAGDISGFGGLNEIINFLNWFSKLNFKYKIFIPGNHDFYFENSSKEDIKILLSNYSNVIYLQDSGIDNH